jgi:hypothetical protein
VQTSNPGTAYIVGKFVSTTVANLYPAYRTVSASELGAGIISDVAVAADAAIALSKQATNTTQRLELSLLTGRGNGGLVFTATKTASQFAIVEGGTGVGTLVGEDAQNNTKTSYGIWDVILPFNYVAATNLTVTAKAKSAAVAGGTTVSGTVDVEAFECSESGTVGADICATAAQADTDTLADYAFTITGTGLVAGDRVRLIVKMTTTEGGNTGTAGSTLSGVKVTTSVK